MAATPAHEERNKAFREGLANPAAAREASIPTREVVPATCEQLGVEHRAEDVPESDGARIWWIGDSSPENVILYFHGGGFGLPPFPGHIMFIVQTQQKLAEEEKPFAVAFLEYSLTPQHKFPAQNMQAVQALKHLLKSGREPGNVLIAGDSAGGNLTLNIISASLHTHAGIPELKLSSPLRGAILISPWTSFSANTQSYTDDKDKDIVTLEIMTGLRDDFVNSLDKDEFAEPAQADAAWWKDAPVKSILNLAGAHELFLDYIKDLGGKMKEAGLNVKTVECEKQVHIDCVLDAQAGFEPGPMTRAIRGWLGSVL